MFVAKCSLPGKNNFNPTQLQRQSLLWSYRKVVQRFYNHTKSFTHTGELKGTASKSNLEHLKRIPTIEIESKKVLLKST